MKLEDKIKAFSRVLSKRYPFIKEIKVDDDSFSNTLFLKAKIDPQEMADSLGIKLRQIYLTDLTVLGIFAINDNDKELLYNLNRKINNEISELNELFPENLKLSKVPNVLTYHTINSPSF